MLSELWEQGLIKLQLFSTPSLPIRSSEQRRPWKDSRNNLLREHIGKVKFGIWVSSARKSRFVAFWMSVFAGSEPRLDERQMNLRFRDDSSFVADFFRCFDWGVEEDSIEMNDSFSGSGLGMMRKCTGTGPLEHYSRRISSASSRNSGTVPSEPSRALSTSFSILFLNYASDQSIQYF